MFRRIRTSIRSEPRALAALAAVTAAVAAAVALVLLVGDQRRLTVVLASPGEGETIALVRPALTLTFNVAADREAVAAALAIDPPIPGTIRWRGRALDYAFSGPLAPGDYTLTLASGPLGRRGERLDADYVLRFTVREPGVAYVVAPPEGGEVLVAAYAVAPPRELVRGTRVRDFAVSPDGDTVAAVVERDGRVVLDLIDAATSARRTLADPLDFELASVVWGPDNATLLCVRRDRLRGGGFGVARLWLVRLTGEFAGQIGEEGEPVAGGTWSPDGQRIAYAAPATAEIGLRTLATSETVRYAASRARAPSWSPDGALIAYEAVDRDFREGASPLQPVIVQPLAGGGPRVLGVQGEIRAAPRFLDATTLLTLRKEVGPGARGTELLFEALPEGRVLRSIDLAAGSDLVLDWELSPAGDAAVYAVRSGRSVVVLRVDFEAGVRTVVAQGGDRPKWLP